MRHSTLSSSKRNLWSQHCWLHGFHDVCPTDRLSSFSLTNTSSEKRKVVRNVSKFKNDKAVFGKYWNYIIHIHQHIHFRTIIRYRNNHLHLHQITSYVQIESWLRIFEYGKKKKNFLPKIHAVDFTHSMCCLLWYYRFYCCRDHENFYYSSWSPCCRLDSLPGYFLSASSRSARGYLLTNLDILLICR